MMSGRPFLFFSLVVGLSVLTLSFNNCSSNFSAVEGNVGASSLLQPSGSTGITPPTLPIVDVVVSNDGVRATSSDGGQNWLYTNVGGFPNDCWGYRGIAYGDGLFVAVTATGGFGRISTSPDGVHWRNFESSAGADGITFGGGMFVSDSFTSTDGYNFHFRNLNVDVGNHQAFAYIDGHYIVSGALNGIAVSTDGSHFTMALANYTSTDRLAYFSNMTHFAVGNGIIVGIAPYRIATSTDSGTTWNNQDDFFGYGTSPITSPLQYNSFNSIVFDGKQFAIYGGAGTYGNSGAIWTSADGIHWSEAMTNASVMTVGGDSKSHLLAFTRQNSFFTNDIFNSLDFGSTWTHALSFAPSNFYDFSTSLAPVANMAIATIGNYSAGGIASGLASSDPSQVPTLPASVLLSHTQLAATACGPNLPAGR